MTRIEAPSWATQPRLEIMNVSVAEFARIQTHRRRMLAHVNRELEAYLNDSRLYFTGTADGFPNRDRMTGEYYLGGESYIAHADPTWFQIGVMCHCLEQPWGPFVRVKDYLGLEVWLRCTPRRWSFSVFRNTDSSSI
jgi:hypothetical protein